MILWTLFLLFTFTYDGVMVGGRGGDKAENIGKQQTTAKEFSVSLLAVQVLKETIDSLKMVYIHVFIL
jgi:hypothetical protein